MHVVHQKGDIIEHNANIKRTISGLMFLLPQTVRHLLQVSLTIVHQVIELLEKVSFQNSSCCCFVSTGISQNQVR